MKYKCVLCKGNFEGFGNNAMPLAEGRCCDSCNCKVIEERLRQFKLQKDTIKELKK